jgi:hypothetical protein
MIIECIKQGFSLTNRNWQLVIVRIVAALINIFLLFLFIGVPVFLAIVALGIDLAQTKDAFPDLLSNPGEVIPKYIGLIVLFMVSVILYTTVVSVITLYVFGGTIGTLRNAAFSLREQFSLSSFFQEAKLLFFPLLWLYSFILLVATGLLIVFGILAGIIIFFIHAYGEQRSGLTVFITSFFTLLLAFLVITSSLGGLIFTVYSTVALVIEKKGVMDSLKRAWEFLKNRPAGFLFYLILMFGILGVNIIVLVFGGVIQFIPVVGIFVSIPYQLAYYTLQVYLGIVMWSSVLMYYLKGTNQPVYDAMYDI